MPQSAQELDARPAQWVKDPRRLAVVHRVAMLDSTEEETFDSLTRLAMTLLGVAGAVMSIVDAERDFYKSACGFPQPLASAREWKGRTLCHYALGSADPLVIEDTQLDPRWMAVPMVQNLEVRAYAGVPIMVDGQPIGCFGVFDNKARPWTALQVETLVQLSRAATRELVLRSAVKDAQAAAEKAQVAAELAQALAKAKEELLAVVAHDLRSPIQIIGLNATLLGRAKQAASLPPLQRIESAVASMKRLVDDLLSTHSGNGGDRALFFDIAASRLLADAADTMGMVAERAQIRLQLVPGAAGEVCVDYAQVLRVLCNLIGNCLKYCPAGTTVVLDTVLVDSGIALRVTDNGPGMSEAEQARAFERGWQGEAGVAGQSGVGLGLWIVRTLVEQNHGSVVMQSTLGKGTAVSVQFPRLGTLVTAE